MSFPSFPLGRLKKKSPKVWRESGDFFIRREIEREAESKIHLERNGCGNLKLIVLNQEH
jgi:hypothetical protein